MIIRDKDKARLRLRQLDGCLQALEDAHEGDHRTVPEHVAAHVGSIVPTVTTGMPISEAINLVLHDQERYVGDTGAVLLGPEDVCEHPLDGAAARDLTDRIRQATRQVCMLLYEAHRRRAWQALGYASWDQYVRTELALSRTRSYELVDQGRTMFALRAAAGISAFPEISAYAAEQIKPYMPEVIEAVRVRAAGLPEPQALATVMEVVSEHRDLVARERPQREARPAGRTEIAILREAIERLASLPPPGDLVATLHREDVERLAGLDRALTWLVGFADAVRGAPPAAGRPAG